MSELKSAFFNDFFEVVKRDLLGELFSHKIHQQSLLISGQLDSNSFQSQDQLTDFHILIVGICVDPVYHSHALDLQ